MAFDFKKAQKELYFPQNTPSLIHVPPMQYIAMDGQGDPNDSNGDYQRAIAVLYAVAYTLRMSYKSGHRIEGFFEYVVPPLEGFWTKDLSAPEDKSLLSWTALLRLPDFIRPEDLDWAKETASIKKKLDCSAAKLLFTNEGLCVQLMHHGSYDDEPVSVEKMASFAQEKGFRFDFCKARRHHEIYLSDPRKTPVEQRKTVLRLPIRPL